MAKDKDTAEPKAQTTAPRPPADDNDKATPDAARSHPDEKAKAAPPTTPQGGPAGSTGHAETGTVIRDEQANPERHVVDEGTAFVPPPVPSADDDARRLKEAQDKGGQVFRMKSAVTGMDYPVGTPVSEFDFPKGTDFARLVRLECVEPVGELKAARRRPADPDDLDAIENVHNHMTEFSDQCDRRFKALEDRIAKLEAGGK